MRSLVVWCAALMVVVIVVLIGYRVTRSHAHGFPEGVTIVPGVRVTDPNEKVVGRGRSELVALTADLSRPGTPLHRRVRDALLRLDVPEAEHGNLAETLARRAVLWQGSTGLEYGTMLRLDGIDTKDRYEKPTSMGAWRHVAGWVMTLEIDWNSLTLLTPEQAMAEAANPRAADPGASPDFAGSTVGMSHDNSRGEGDLIGNSGGIRRVLIARVPAIHTDDSGRHRVILHLTLAQRNAEASDPDDPTRQPFTWVATSLFGLNVPPNVFVPNP